MMMMNGMASRGPCCGRFGYWACSLVINDCSMPMPMPAAVTTANDRMRATRRQPSAGMMNRVYWPGSSDAMGTRSTPASAASMVANDQLAAEIQCADQPRSTVPFSFSESASVTRPNRVKR